MDPQSGKSIPPVSTTQMDVFAATVDWKIADGLSLKSITAFQEYSGQFGFESGDSPVVISDQKNYQSNHTFTHELRLNGSLRMGPQRAADLLSSESTVGRHFRWR